jgi:hypothetical protein
MKTLLLYGSEIQLTPHHVRVFGFPQYWVRAATVKAGNAELALGLSKPMKGETLLNSVEVEND